MSKAIYDEVLKELIKIMKDLKVEMKKLKRSQKSTISNILKGLRRCIKRYMWYDSPNHKYNICTNYKEGNQRRYCLFKKMKDKTFKL